MNATTSIPSLVHLPTAHPRLSSLKMREALVTRVLQQSDDLVLVLEYADKKGSVTRRVVSPIRFLAPGRFLALCLSRQEPRQFYLDRCHNIRVDLAMRYVMPVELVELQATSMEV